MIKKAVLLSLIAMFLIFDISHAAEKTKKLKDGSELVFIQGGNFQMGGDEYNWMLPRHIEKINAFYIGKYEVTNIQYKKFCDKTKRGYPPNPDWDKDYFLNKPDYPVINVSWKDVAAYAKWAGGRLLTEAEWEYSAVGGTVTPFYWGNEFSSDYANGMGMKGKDKWQYTSPVGSFPPNPYGLYDMFGNVWEWVADVYTEPANPDPNPKGLKGTVRVLKGDGWNGIPYNVGIAGRDGESFTDWKAPYIGFRIAVGTR